MADEMTTYRALADAIFNEREQAALLYGDDRQALAVADNVLSRLAKAIALNLSELERSFDQRWFLAACEFPNMNDWKGGC